MHTPTKLLPHPLKKQAQGFWRNADSDSRNRNPSESPNPHGTQDFTSARFLANPLAERNLWRENDPKRRSRVLVRADAALWGVCPTRCFCEQKTAYSLRGDLCPLSYESGTFGAKMLKSKKNQRGSRAHSSGFARLNARSIPLNLRSDPLLFMFPSPPFSCPPTPILRSRGTSRGTSPKIQC